MMPIFQEVIDTSVEIRTETPLQRQAPITSHAGDPGHSHREEKQHLGEVEQLLVAQRDAFIRRFRDQLGEPGQGVRI